ncbi:MAG: DUF3795 domain-containing protein [Candidatus Bathyarchaeia archaeon]
MVNKNLIGRCGLFCGTCPIYRAYEDSRKLQEALAKEYNCSPEDVRCEGCQVVMEEGWAGDENWGKNCKIIKCLDARGLNFCYECDVYDQCERFGDLFESTLKYGENLRKNLERIKVGEAEQWLAEEEKRWRCPNCKKPASMYLPECHWCGAKLSYQQPPPF